MLQVNQVSKTFGIQPILDRVSFVINPNERVGMIGPNGSGKTTLLRIIAGLEQPDAGVVSLAPDITLGYLAQGLEKSFGLTVGEVVLSGIRGLPAAQRQMEALAEQMATSDDTPPQLLESYGEAL
jgi:ATPase subunit of ABC transporter with duplicated ATPase domains